MRFSGYWLVLLGFTGFYWVFLGCRHILRFDEVVAGATTELVECVQRMQSRIQFDEPVNIQFTSVG